MASATAAAHGALASGPPVSDASSPTSERAGRSRRRHRATPPGSCCATVATVRSFQTGSAIERAVYAGGTRLASNCTSSRGQSARTTRPAAPTACAGALNEVTGPGDRDALAGPVEGAAGSTGVSGTGPDCDARCGGGPATGAVDGANGGPALLSGAPLLCAVGPPGAGIEPSAGA